MPRKSRIDAPGALHHIIVRGIESRCIFENDHDRNNFLNRLGDILTDQLEKKYKLRTQGFTLERTAARAAEVLGIDAEKVWAAGRGREIVQARSLFCYWAARELGVTMTSLSRRLDMSISAIAKAVLRGEKMAKANRYSLL